MKLLLLIFIIIIIIIYGLSELRSCVKVEVDVLGSPSLINLRFLWT